MSINPKSLKEIIKIKFDDFFYYFQNNNSYRLSIKKLTEYITDNVLSVLPPILDKHSQLDLDDGTNPHGTTKLDIGLGNVDNTSDADKPISSATALEFTNVYNEVSTKANNYVDIANIISGYILTDTDAGKLITNSGINVRTLVIPSSLNLPNNTIFIKGRIAIQPNAGVNIELPDTTIITSPTQFTCVADEVYILHKSAFTGNDYILVSVKKSENIGTNDLIITDTIRELQVATDGTFQIVTNDANNSSVFKVGENSNERFSDIELNSITYDVTTAEPNPTNNGTGIITRINPNEYEVESRSDIGNSATKRSRIYTSPGEVILEKTNAGKLTLNSLGASNTFEDLRATKKGLEYFADYSANFSVRSLVDKGYVDAGLSDKIGAVIEDTTPQLGGDLDLNGNDINGTGNVDITGNVIADIVQLRGGVGAQGEISWSTDEETVQLVMDGTTLHIGQDTFVHARNNTASIITKGTAVYATGTLGASGRITVAPMIADGTIAGRLFIGLAAEDIAIGADGQVMTFGKIRQINTNSYNDGDVLWLSPTVAGQLTTTEPTAPNLKIATAFVIHAATNGTLMVRAEQGTDLHTDQRVQVSGLTNNDVLTWNNSNQRWQNAQITLPDAYGGKRYTLIKSNGTQQYYDNLSQVRLNWADGDALHQFADETLSITNTTTISGYLCWSELPAISWEGNGHSVLFNVTNTSAFAVNASKNINLFDLRLTYNCVDNSTTNGLIKSPTTSFLNGNGSTTLVQNVTASSANHLNAFGLIGNFDNFNITSLHDKTWQVPGFCNGTFTNCNIRNVYTNRAATFIGCNFNDFVANLFSATNIIFDNCTLVNSADALLTSNQGTVTITNCNMRFNVNSGIIMNATVVMNNSTINNVGNGLMFAAYSGSYNICRTTGSGGFLNTASVVTDIGSMFESTGGWNFRFTGSGSFFERTKFINNGTGGSLNTDVSGTGLKASFVDCIFFCAGTNNVGAVSDTYSFVGCTFNRTNFAFMYSGTQQQLLDNIPQRLTQMKDSLGNFGHGLRGNMLNVTTAQMNAISSPVINLIVYNTDLNGLYRYNGSAWVALSSGYGIIGVYSGSGNGTPTFFATLQSALETCKASGGYFTVKLYSNITITSAIEIDYANTGVGNAYLFRQLTIDFNGFSVTNAQANTSNAFTVELSNSASVYQEIKFINGAVLRTNGTGTHHALRADTVGRFGTIQMNNMFWYCQNSIACSVALNNTSTQIGINKVCDLGGSTFVSQTSTAFVSTNAKIRNFNAIAHGSTFAISCASGEIQSFYVENTSTGIALAMGGTAICKNFDALSNSGTAVNITAGTLYNFTFNSVSGIGLNATTGTCNIDKFSGNTGNNYGVYVLGQGVNISNGKVYNNSALDAVYLANFGTAHNIEGFNNGSGVGLLIGANQVARNEASSCKGFSVGGIGGILSVPDSTAIIDVTNCMFSSDLNTSSGHALTISSSTGKIKMTNTYLKVRNSGANAIHATASRTVNSRYCTHNDVATTPINANVTIVSSGIIS